MTTIEAVGAPTSVLSATRGEVSPTTPSTEVATLVTGIDSAIARAKSKGSAPGDPLSGQRRTKTVEQVVDSVVTIVVGLIDVAVQVLSLVKEKGGSGSKEPVQPKPIPLLPHKDPPSVAKPSAPREMSPVKRLEAVQDDHGVVTVRTQDGYIVRAEGKEAAWSISAPDGRTTRIFGDAHVLESDGGRWDFKQRGTFVFGANKVTVETSPLKKGAFVSSRLTIYSGGERVTIGGIDKNKPSILALASDAQQHDDSLSDGTLYARASTKNGESWWLFQNNKKTVMGGK